MKKILGLDLGTNSIGWALVNEDGEKSEILGIGSRIIPMSQDILGDFDKGNSISQTAERTGFRGVRRLRERHLLRRERLHRVLNILGFLPEHYANSIDFSKRLGQFIPESEPKLVYKYNPETKKAEFIFKQSFNEMVLEFKQQQPHLFKEGKKIPYDWTIYYLRKKALSDKIDKQELAWLLLNFNQKRGYYQLRGEDDEDATRTAQTRTYFLTEKIDAIIDTNELYKGLKIFKIQLANGEIGKCFNKQEPNWLGLEKNIIVTVDTDKDGNDKIDKDGSVAKRFSIPTDEDWEKKWKLIKIKTEKEIRDSSKTVGCYIYNTLLQKPTQKINGKLVRTIERKFYKQELEAILIKQKEFHPELNSPDLYKTCIEELYEYNEAQQNSLIKQDFTHLFLNDIIFYQRPLKSKKSLINNCQYEVRNYLKDGELKEEAVKCIAKSHPLFQEFRLWQFLQNLRIYSKETIIDGSEANVTDTFLKTEDDWCNLFDWLNDRKEIDQKAFLKYPGFNLKKDADKYRWNYVEDKLYPCNETRTLINNRLSKLQNVSDKFLTPDVEESLWHILYSVEDKHDIVKALKTFAEKNQLGDDFVESFKKFPPFKKEYGSYSYKAISKLLPLMRRCKYWNENNIAPQTIERINKIINGEVDEKISERVRTKSLSLRNIQDFQNLPLWLACYVVYNRHSEAGDIKSWKTPADIEAYLRNEFKQHSLRNPIVEQVITETLRVVKDIWKQYGKDAENFFNEIHIELGREMKNPADKRKQMTNQINENENTNLRIKALLMEMLNDGAIEDVRPYSPSQQEILKIYEDGVLSSALEIPEEILKISKMAQPSTSELTRYKLWLDQKYRSPYTGEFIPLAKLFTPDYEIEHIIPQSRYFDDSFSNKVICESEVNKDKDNSTAYEYIKNNSGKKIELSYGKTITLYTLENYEKNVKIDFEKNRSKMKKLLMEDIPEAFIARQLNDSRYISKLVKGLLSNIVREEGEQESTSKNVLSSNGTITNTLKQDWGLNDVWNELITPRFERLNELTNSNNFGQWTNKGGKNVFQTEVPIQFQKGFSKKRIDHRHHAMDALVIACATRNHINYLNNEYAKADSSIVRFELRNKLRRLENIQVEKVINGEKVVKNLTVAKEFLKPWNTFTQDAKEKLFGTVVSFKQNLRVINKTVNNYQKWELQTDGTKKKVTVKQTQGDSWAIRKPMHKDTVSGSVTLRYVKTIQLSAAIDNFEMIVDKSLKQKIKELHAQNFDKKKIQKFFKDIENKWNEKDISKVEIYDFDTQNAASRVKLDESFNSEKIKSITDTGIKKILLAHLANYTVYKDGKQTEQPELAFSADGIDEMNNNITALNEGKFHHPIYKVRTYEPKGNKFAVGQTGNKKDKYVEAAKGTNLFFAVYVDENGKRNYESIPLNIVIDLQKHGLGSVPETNEKGDKLLFHLSPNDLVYVPNIDEQPQMVDFKNLTLEQVKRIYKFVDGSETTANFIPYYVSDLIFNLPKKEAEKFKEKNNQDSKGVFQNEFGIGSPQSKNQKSIEGIMIKEFCWKLKVDRLGNIVKVIK